ncbi:MAG: zf-TFIIB domain-containing protein [Phycisphaerae bacterium]|nr:zf-TFIIB domain-containing protein [Phycisphaerae bacterium]
MAATPVSDLGYDEGERYFHERDAELLARLRAKLDKDRSTTASSSDRPPNWMRCPKCGGQLVETDLEAVKIDRCAACGGVFLDKGELEVLTKHGRAATQTLFGKLFG